MFHFEFNLIFQIKFVVVDPESKFTLGGMF